MEAVGVRELRQNLSVYLRRVARGEALRVTDRGRPVALLTPLPAGDQVLAELVSLGKVVPPRGSTDDVPPPLQLPAGTPSLSAVVAGMRDEDPR